MFVGKYQSVDILLTTHVLLHLWPVSLSLGDVVIFGVGGLEAAIISQRYKACKIC